jgi:predicted aspartyl protease
MEMKIISTRYPYLEVEVSIRDHRMRDWAYVDTGFDGFLIVPEKYRDTLGTGDYVSQWELGDSSMAYAEDYLGRARIIGLPTSLTILITCLGDEFLVGRGIIDHYRMTFNHGRTLEVELST